MESLVLVNRPSTSPLMALREPHTHFRWLGKTRLEGEKDLERVSRQAGREDCWLYIEGLTKEGDSLSVWYEIGVFEDAYSVNPDYDALRYIKEDLEKLHLDFKTASVMEYHIHPVNPDTIFTFEFRLEEAKSDYGLNWREIVEFKNNSFSDGDLYHAYAGLENYLQHLGIQPSVKVVGPLGIWTLQTSRPRDKNDEEVQGTVSSYRRYRKQIGRPLGFFNEVLSNIPIFGVLAMRHACDTNEIIRLFSLPALTITFELHKD